MNTLVNTLVNTPYSCEYSCEYSCVGTRARMAIAHATAQAWSVAQAFFTAFCYTSTTFCFTGTAALCCTGIAFRGRGSVFYCAGTLFCCAGVVFCHTGAVFCYTGAVFCCTWQWMSGVGACTYARSLFLITRARRRPSRVYCVKPLKKSASAVIIMMPAKES